MSLLKNGRPYSLAFRGMGLCNEIPSISGETIPRPDDLHVVSPRSVGDRIARYELT